MKKLHALNSTPAKLWCYFDARNLANVNRSTDRDVRDDIAEKFETELKTGRALDELREAVSTTLTVTTKETGLRLRKDNGDTFKRGGRNFLIPRGSNVTFLKEVRFSKDANGQHMDTDMDGSLENRHTWFKVQLPTGEIGWASAEYLKGSLEGPAADITPTPGLSPTPDVTVTPDAVAPTPADILTGLSTVPPADFARVPLERLAAIPADIFGRLPKDMIAALGPDKLGKLPVTHLAAIPPATVLALDPVTLRSVGPTVVNILLEGMDPADADKVRASIAIDLTAPTLRDRDALAALDADTFKAATPDELKALSPTDLATLPVHTLPPATLVEIPAEKFAELPPTTVRDFPADTLEDLTPEILDALGEKLAELPAETVTALDEATYQAILERIPDAAKPDFEAKREAAEAPADGEITIEDLRSGDVDAFKAVTLEQLDDIEATELAGLDDAKLNTLDAAKINGLGPDYTQHFRASTLEGFPADVLNDLDDPVIESLLPKLATLPVEKLATLDDTIVDKITNSLPEADREAFNDKVDAARAAAEAADDAGGDIEVDDDALTVDKLNTYTVVKFKALTVEDISTLTPADFANVKPALLSQLPFETLEGIPHYIAKFNRDTIMAIPASTLKELRRATTDLMLSRLTTEPDKDTFKAKLPAAARITPVNYGTVFKDSYLGSRFPEFEEAVRATDFILPGEDVPFQLPKDAVATIIKSMNVESGYEWNAESNGYKKAFLGALHGALEDATDDHQDKVNALDPALKTRIKGAMEQLNDTFGVITESDDHELYLMGVTLAPLLRDLVAANPEFKDIINAEITDRMDGAVASAGSLIGLNLNKLPKNYDQLLVFLESMPRTFGPFQVSLHKMRGIFKDNPDLKTTAPFDALFPGGTLDQDGLVESLLGVVGAPVGKKEITQLLLQTYWRTRYENHNQGTAEDAKFMRIETLTGDLSTYNAAVQKKLNGLLTPSPNLAVDGDLANYGFMSPEPILSGPDKSNSQKALERFIDEHPDGAPLQAGKGGHIKKLIKAKSWAEIKESKLYKAIMGDEVGARLIPEKGIPDGTDLGKYLA